MWVKLFLSPILFFVFNAISAPTATTSRISGALHDELTGQPISFATVAAYKESDSSLVSGSITDENGRFSIDLPSPEIYYLEISMVGFEKHYLNHMMVQDLDLDLGIISLAPKTTTLDGVEVVSERSAIEHLIDRKVIDVTKLGVSYNASLAEALQLLPSIETDPQGNISLRGSVNFQVLIDGKLSMISPGEALQQYTVAQVEKIEVITNPSAKYQANSTSGIVNIILKKDQVHGFSGFFSLGSSLGINHFQPYNFSTNLNYTRRKYRLTGTFSTTDRQLEFHFTTKQRRTNGTDLDIFSINHVPWQRIGASLDFDYHFNENHVLTLASRIIQNDNEFDIKGENFPLETSTDPFFSRVKGFTNRHTRAITLHDAIKFDNNGHELTLLATYFHQYVDQRQTFHQYPDLTKAKANAKTNSKTGSDHDQLQLKADYTHPLKTGKLEMGADMMAMIRNSLRSSEVLIPEISPYSIDQFRLTGETLAGYTTFSRTVWGIDVRAGLRVELYNRILKQKDTVVVFNYSRLNLFPGLHLAKKIKENQELKLNYTRRINRPTMSQLQPYLDWSDNVRSYGGNPNLTPSTIDSYEMSYTRWLGKITIGLESYLRITNNEITIGEQLNKNTGIIEGSPVNIDHSQILGVEPSFETTTLKWLKISLSGTWFQNRLRGELFETRINRQYNGWRTRINNTLNLSQKVKLSINGYYNSKVMDAQGEVSKDYWMDISLNMPVLNSQGHLSLDMQDVFGTGSYGRIRSGNGFVSSLNMRTPRMIVGVNFTYKLNNFKNKSTMFRFED